MSMNGVVNADKLWSISKKSNRLFKIINSKLIKLDMLISNISKINKNKDKYKLKINRNKMNKTKIKVKNNNNNIKNSKNKNNKINASNN